MKQFVFFALLLAAIATQSASAKTISAGSFISQRSRTEIVNPLAKASYYFVDPVELAKNLSGGGHTQLTNFPCGNGEYVTFRSETSPRRY